MSASVMSGLASRRSARLKLLAKGPLVENNPMASRSSCSNSICMSDVSMSFRSSMSSRGTVPLLEEAETPDTEDEEEDEPRLDSLDAADFLAATAEVGLGGGRGWVRSLTGAREVGAVRGGGKAGEALCLTDSAGVKVCDRVTSSGDGEGVP